MEFISEDGKVDYNTYYESFYEIDKELNAKENRFDKFGAIPYIGTLTSIIRVCHSVLFISLIKLVQRTGEKRDPRIDRCIVLINILKANMVPGFIQMLPGVGTIYYLYRRSLIPNEKNFALTIITGHENRVVPFDSLVARDWKFVGTDTEAVTKASQIYKVKMEEMGGERFLSISERLFVAKQIVTDISEKRIPNELKEIKVLV